MTCGCPSEGVFAAGVKSGPCGGHEAGMVRRRTLSVYPQGLLIVDGSVGKSAVRITDV